MRVPYIGFPSVYFIEYFDREGAPVETGD